MWQQLPTAAEAATAHEAYQRSAFSLHYLVRYFRCKVMDQPLPTGQLKRGLAKADGTPYPEFPWVLNEIHQRLMKPLSSEGRLPREAK